MKELWAKKNNKEKIRDIIHENKMWKIVKETKA